MQDSLGSLVNLLESYRGRDKVVRTLCYGSQLVGGLVDRKAGGSSQLGKSLLLLSAQLSHCRTVLRLFDDLPMAAYSAAYGLGAGEEDGVVRWISVLTNVADQLYYPCEHVAWAADSQMLGVPAEKWWTLSTLLWAASLLLGVLRSARVLLLLGRKLRRCAGRSDCSEERGRLRRQMTGEMLAIAGGLADLSNAVHWMPAGVLWAGRFPVWLVGLMGTVSSLIGLSQAGCSSA
ncbi:peroxisomal membrane protein 11C [Denticeps clupeoides]|uniref:peroxisomal membrane protein 11C n=1 Tax=Denticeps clupeoides TaxID=299321 RepID=UPI0010A469A3|nr:peroxisomal membrane protein 11C [Denticeps clupeoides]